MIGAVVVVAGLAFGAMGGEYNTRNWFTLRRQLRDEQDAVAQLKVDIDSLGRAAKALETDPATQERVAREAFGMHRPGEILYKIERLPVEP